ncbi:glycosyltransferase family protein [Colwellia sp. KU-HH00111]|uniref:glycosyltransferase family protein n=1 Tax=Colwellia sp. KU-HH00111 TaxID=3127652 RepID=UPI0031053E73
MSINVILQARLSSTRLPGKVLKDIVNKPMLALQIERIKRAEFIDNIIVATSVEQADDAIEQLCNKLAIPCFRGSLNDVLDRFYSTQLAFPSDHIVRLTGDCPLIEPTIIDQVIDLHLKQAADYTSNCLTPCLPDGLDVEVFTHKALTVSWQQAVKPSEREHVTQYMRNHSELFRLINFQYQPDLSKHRWTVDEPSDFTLIKTIYENLYPINPNFTMQDVLALLKKQPELSDLNSKFNRNQGLENSIAYDKEQGFE